jgi:DNA polymerase-1
MMIRGIKVDNLSRGAAVRYLRKKAERAQEILNRYGEVLNLPHINPNSPAQLKSLFYQVMKIPEHHTMVKGERKVSTNRETLEKLHATYFHTKPFINCILSIRDLGKQISFLTSQVDNDGRIRTSYNVAGTETGRWSSSTNAFGGGTNLQNYPDKLRSVFVADPGRKMAYLDLEQAESWIVGLKLWEQFKDDRYIQAIRSGDLHTTVARMVWPSLPWSGDIKEDRKRAEAPFYRDFSYRDMAKRGGHGTNYYGTPRTMAKHLKVPVRLMEDFQNEYIPAFGMRKWHSWVAMQLQTTQQLTTLLGRTRHFFGRPNDDTTLREAIAFEPQSVVGDLLNLAAWRTWKHGPDMGIRLLAQLHDAILIDFPDNGDEFEEQVSTYMAGLMRTPLSIRGETFVIPNDFSSGWNWGKFNDDPKRGPINLGGVKKRSRASKEQRKRPPLAGLDRVIPSFY